MNYFAWAHRFFRSWPSGTCSSRPEWASARDFSATTDRRRRRKWAMPSPRSPSVTLTSRRSWIATPAASTRKSLGCWRPSSRCEGRGRSRTRRSFPRWASATEIAGFGRSAGWKFGAMTNEQNVSSLTRIAPGPEARTSLIPTPITSASFFIPGWATS